MFLLLQLAVRSSFKMRPMREENAVLVEHYYVLNMRERVGKEQVRRSLLPLACSRLHFQKWSDLKWTLGKTLRVIILFFMFILISGTMHTALVPCWAYFWGRSGFQACMDSVWWFSQRWGWREDPRRPNPWHSMKERSCPYFPFRRSVFEWTHCAWSLWFSIHWGLFLSGAWKCLLFLSSYQPL